ncbi:MAG: AmmeMemoRadiSam system protein B [Candidatus Coatesbacteria bacterium]
MLRRVDAYPVEVEGEEYIALRDPEGVVEDVMLLSPAAFLIASMLDGTATVTDMRATYARAFDGRMVEEHEIRKVIAELDLRGFLDTPGFRLKRAEARRRWGDLPVRPASHAGGAYPDDPRELAAYLGGFFTAEGGPGLLAGATPRRAPRGLVAPHIDFQRGGLAYAHAHRTHREEPLPDLVIVLGVVHSAPPVPFIVTDKAFQTPLGVVSADREAVAAISAGCGGWAREEEIAHRSEHSIEFQLVWLQATHPGQDFTIVPVLCSAFEQFCGEHSPQSDERIARGLESLAGVLRGRRALVIASVDFSHVGPKFGDDIRLDESVAAGVEESDRALLAPLCAGDAEGFWAEGAGDGNPRHVDALSAAYTLLHLLGPDARGTELAYGQAPDPEGGIVSFAAVEFP